MLAGLLHGVGKLYILTRAAKHPGLFADQVTYNTIVRDCWHANIAKALLENWDMAEEIIEAVHGYEDIERDGRGAVGLVDVLATANLFSSFKDQPDLLEARLAECKPAGRLGIDRAAFDAIVVDSAAEIESPAPGAGSVAVTRNIGSRP